MKIAALAEASYVKMAPHVWGGPIILAAALQIDASIPNFLIQECIGKGGEFFDEIVKEPFVWEDGDLLIPDRPGIGIELDEGPIGKIPRQTQVAAGSKVGSSEPKVDVLIVGAGAICCRLCLESGRYKDEHPLPGAGRLVKSIGVSEHPDKLGVGQHDEQQPQLPAQRG